ncbi:MAG TPA: potassium transporter TrkG [Candidatus Babeliales bacterium]|nr:potassium transporter TrkG [Candidatus Babeliales bacterium]
MGKKKLIDISPAHIIIFSFFILIICGTLLLALPIAHIQSIAFIDLLFTATSATCVTGLFTIPLSNFTFFGKTVILGLIQIGALGLATMSLFIISLFIDLGLGTRFMAGQLFELDSWENIKKILIFTFTATITLEVIGALLFFSIFKVEYSLKNALFYSFFHSISAFCNAGISFFHFLTEQNLQRYSTNYLFLITTSFLTFFGGLGFITWHEIMLHGYAYFFSKKPHRFSLHSKIILYGTSVLLVVATILFLILENSHTLHNVSIPLKCANAVFHAISFKSCGFVLGNLPDFHTATIFFIMIIGLIGSAPGSTGSGIKITSLVLFLSTIRSAINGQTSVKIFEREIPLDQIYKVIAIIALSIGWILFTTFCLLLTETSWNFLDVFFETVSAFSNVGFSYKGTEKLSDFGKLFIMATMFIGRIGSLTFILGLKLKTRKETIEFSYPEERVMLG